ncbi:SIMPL domain-containing protein [bacterium]|nr:SIMPL domain-containing protein [bacterium]
MAERRISNNDGGLFFIAIAIVVAAFIAGNAVKAVKRAGDTIQVTGSAKMSVVSDYIVWRGEVRTDAQTLKQSSQQLLRYRQTVEAFLTDQGVLETEVTWQAPSIWEQREYVNGQDTGRILRYNASQMFIIRSSRVDAIAEVAKAAEQLMREGVPFNPFTPEFTYSKLNEARIELMEEATRDARARAEKIAAAADNEVGPIREARMGVIQVVAPNSTNVSDYGMYDTTTKDKDVIAVVKVSFAVE